MLNDNPEKGTIFVRVYRKDVFGFIRHVDKIKYGLGNTLTMRRANSGKSIYRTIGDETKVENKDIVWYVRRDTPSFYNLSLGCEHILAKKNTEFHMFQGWFRINLSIRTTIGRWKESLSREMIPIYVTDGFKSAVRAGPYRYKITLYLIDSMLLKHRVMLEP